MQEVLIMCIRCKLAGIKYDFEQRNPIIIKLEHRMCTVETELNKNNPCAGNHYGRSKGHRISKNCGGCNK